MSRRADLARRRAIEQAQREKQMRAQARDAERLRKVAEARARAEASARAANDRERKRLYVEAREHDARFQTEEIEGRVERLRTLLASTLPVDDYLDFVAMKQEPAIPMFEPGKLAIAEPGPSLESYLPLPLTGMGRLVPGAKGKHEEQVRLAHATFEDKVSARATREAERERLLAAARTDHDSVVEGLRAECAAANAEVDLFHEDFDAGKPDAVALYFKMVLEASVYPEGFPKRARLAFVPESKQLVVEYELPTTEVVPESRAVRYVKARDIVEGQARPVSERRSIYASMVAQIALRTLHELFESDRDAHLETVVLNGFVDTIDPATGLKVHVFLLTVRTTRDRFLQLDLELVDPIACLKGLGAGVSKSPAELVPVRPVLEFNMVDSRFIEESDVLSGLDQRPNLMELTPSEFESLITNLFSKMGLDTRQTQASRDGGVDCVAFDPRPIFGGKVVIQAKRYRHTVGVSAVRDLFGTMQNEGATKGILVSTSGYGKASFEFAEGKPLELISGSGLLYLLAENAGIDAKIEVPPDWVDQLNDQPDVDFGTSVGPSGSELHVPPNHETAT